MSSKPTPGPKLEWRLTPYFDRHGRVDPHRFQSIVLAKVDQQFGCEGVILTTGYKGAEVDDIWVGASPDHVSLILEAGTIFEQTGLTPQQLRERVEHAEKRQQEAFALIETMRGNGDELREHMNQLLAALRLVREFNCKHAPALIDLPFFKSMDAAVFAAIASVEAAS